ncbi:hypothetical protein BCR39DRAFT_509798 [Naematelia encephala]|uniref:F-box domain-containing protein n=1 Tax=Naematelia encephala TaxID=71784 RepID=A0A1Y2BL09_9TREE|nr:hypothetical protein BCR39DRAFT_509798 [Naematelia encephala]
MSCNTNLSEPSDPSFLPHSDDLSVSSTPPDPSALDISTSPSLSQGGDEASADERLSKFPDDIPFDVNERIFSFLDWPDKIRFSRVNRYSRRAFGTDVLVLSEGLVIKSHTASEPEFTGFKDLPWDTSRMSHNPMPSTLVITSYKKSNGTAQSISEKCGPFFSNIKDVFFHMVHPLSSTPVGTRLDWSPETQSLFEWLPDTFALHMGWNDNKVYHIQQNMLPILQTFQKSIRTQRTSITQSKPVRRQITVYAQLSLASLTFRPSVSQLEEGPVYHHHWYLRDPPSLPSTSKGSSEEITVGTDQIVQKIQDQMDHFISRIKGRGRDLDANIHGLRPGTLSLMLENQNVLLPGSEITEVSGDRQNEASNSDDGVPSTNTDVILLHDDTTTARYVPATTLRRLPESDFIS